MKALLWRAILAVICVVLLYALLPPLFAVINLPVDGNVWTVLRVCIAGIAILYVLTGDRPAPPF